MFGKLLNLRIFQWLGKSADNRLTKVRLFLRGPQGKNMEPKRINCTLTKVSTNINDLRTNEVTGYCLELPEENERFNMYGSPLDPNANVRVISTSPVQKLSVDNNNYTLETMNSVYKVNIYL